MCSSASPARSQAAGVSCGGAEQQQALLIAGVGLGRQAAVAVGVEVAQRNVVVRAAVDVGHRRGRNSVEASGVVARPGPELGPVGRVDVFEVVGLLAQSSDRLPMLRRG